MAVDLARRSRRDAAAAAAEQRAASDLTGAISAALGEAGAAGRDDDEERYVENFSCRGFHWSFGCFRIYNPSSHRSIVWESEAGSMRTLGGRRAARAGAPAMWEASPEECVESFSYRGFHWIFGCFRLQNASYIALPW
jgi:hypothetical protein